MISEIKTQPAKMFDVIASSFFQKKSCRLPGIGSLELITSPAVYDFPNRQILAPVERIKFTASSSSDNIFNEFSAISQLLKEKLETEGAVEITGLGRFSKYAGIINFSPVEIAADFSQPVAAEKVIHKDAEHSILVGDRETTNLVMNESYNSDELAAVKKDHWWLWSLLLAAAGAGAILYYWLQYGWNDLASKAGF